MNTGRRFFRPIGHSKAVRLKADNCIMISSGSEKVNVSERVFLGIFCGFSPVFFPGTASAGAACGSGGLFALSPSGPTKEAGLPLNAG